MSSGALDVALQTCPVVAILRARSAARFEQVTDVLVKAGIRAVEFTFTTPDVLTALSSYAAKLPDEVVLGAGTVTTAEQARQAVDAGATYLVSPGVSVPVIEEAVRLDVPVLPGVLTPTEILTATEAGASMVKVFPASFGGPEYLKALRGPFPDVPLVPTGGIDVANAGAYLAAGALAIGVGGPLQGDAAGEGGDLDGLAERARTFVAATSR